MPQSAKKFLPETTGQGNTAFHECGGKIRSNELRENGMLELTKYDGALLQYFPELLQIGRSIPASAGGADLVKKGDQEIQSAAAIRDRKHGASSGYGLDEIGFDFAAFSEHSCYLINSPR